MRRFVLMFTAVLLSCSTTTMVFADNLKKDDVVYAKYSIRGKGKEIFWHNMSSMPALVPAGAEVRIVGINAKEFVIETAGKKFWMVANTAQWDKYFVMNRNDASKVVDNAEVKEGMSKEEVYLAQGCPAYIAQSTKSYFKAMQDIMASDTWYYNATTKTVGALVKFANGKVVSSDPYQKSGKKK